METFLENGSILMEIIIFLIHVIPILLAAKLVYMHYTGQLEHKEAIKKIPIYSIQLLVAISLSLFADSYMSLTTIKANVREISGTMRDIELQTAILKDISNNSNKILINTSLKDEMASVRKTFNPVLDSIFHGYIDDVVSFFDQGINHGRITFQDNQRYRSAYASTLEYLSRALKHPHVIATSIADTSYFWSWRGSLRPAEKAIQRFTEQGGKLRRIFYVDPDFLNDPIVVAILNRQVDSLHVDIRTIDINLVPGEQQRFFVLNNEKKVMWISQINGKHEITTTTFSTNYEEDIKPLVAAFEDMEKYSKKYEPKKQNKWTHKKR